MAQPVEWRLVRLVIATCSVDYDGRLSAHLPLATRLLLVKADGSVLVHSDGGSYKPLNWMTPPTTIEEDGDLFGSTVQLAARLCSHAKPEQSLVSNVVDKATQEKIDVVKSRLIRNYGYNESSATDILNFVASIFARGHTKK